MSSGSRDCFPWPVIMPCIIIAPQKTTARIIMSGPIHGIDQPSFPHHIIGRLHFVGWTKNVNRAAWIGFDLAQGELDKISSNLTKLHAKAL
jgi:hypothetical protein